MVRTIRLTLRPHQIARTTLYSHRIDDPAQWDRPHVSPTGVARRRIGSGTWGEKVWKFLKVDREQFLKRQKCLDGLVYSACSCKQIQGNGKFATHPDTSADVFMLGAFEMDISERRSAGAHIALHPPLRIAQP